MRSFLAVMTVLFLGFWTNPASAQGVPVNTIGARTINVSGEAEIRVVPDQVLISLTAESRGPDLSATQKKNDEAVKGLVSYVTETLGLKREHIQTDYTTVSPTYRSCNYEDEMSGRCNPLDIVYYSVRKGIQIRLNDLSRYEELVAKALQMGVTHIDNIQFITTELRKHRDSARVQAAKAAKEKAEAIAAVLGVKIGKPVSVNTQNFSSFYWHGYGGGPRAYNQMTQNVIQEAAPPAGGEGEGALALGQINITASVQVTFEIE
ncbi:MAG: SIMPL domain-containing protein [Alphaproteobacteria bacterium]|nr:SIMPL domain-containing protein [Alphaproteobacteria bacterium]QQS57927.1 MAG: SIMPL domain-containing protein [Alphaproteobacteria bacterium]